MKRHRLTFLHFALLTGSVALGSHSAIAQSAASPAAPASAKNPNIHFIMGDDIGWMQPSCYHRGLVVGETPSIDRIAAEDALFVDYVAMQSCTVGHVAPITVQSSCSFFVMIPRFPPGALDPARPQARSSPPPDAVRRGGGGGLAQCERDRCPKVRDFLRAA